MSRIASDHSPILVTHKESNSQARKAFRFLHFWVNQMGFFDIVKDAWSLDFECSPVYKLLYKMKQVKKSLISWNSSSVGNIFENLNHLEEEVQRLEDRLQADSQSSELVKLHETKVKLILASNNVCEYWRQKAHVKWLADGDMNSKFFHSCVQSKRLRLHISKIKDNSGNWTENPQEIAQLGITYFQQLYSDELNYSHQYYNRNCSFLHSQDY